MTTQQTYKIQIKKSYYKVTANIRTKRNEEAKKAIEDMRRMTTT